MKRLRIFCGVCLLITTVSCAPVGKVDRTYLDDEDMGLYARRTQIFEINAETYKEGAAGGNSLGKKGGGCGCN